MDSLISYMFVKPKDRLITKKKNKHCHQLLSMVHLTIYWKEYTFVSVVGGSSVLCS